MAYRLSRPGTLEVRTEGRGLAGLIGRGPRYEITRDGVRPLGGKVSAMRPASRVTCVRLGLRTPSGDSTAAAAHDTPPAANTARSPLGYCVDLLLEGDRRGEVLTVLTAPSEPAARQAAEAIAAHMSWPFEDAIGDEIERRQPDEIDHRPDRKPEPDSPMPTGIASRSSGYSSGLVLRGMPPEKRSRLVPIAVGAVLTTTPVAVALAWSFFEGPLLAPLIGAILVADLGTVALLLGLAGSEEEVFVEQGVLRRRLHLGPLPLPTSEIDLRRVERIRIQTRFDELRGCVLVTNMDTLRVGRGLDREALHWLQAWIQSRLP